MLLYIKYRLQIKVNTKNENLGDITNHYIFILRFLMNVYIDIFVVLTYAMLILCLSNTLQKITYKKMMMFLV